MIDVHVCLCLIAYMLCLAACVLSLVCGMPSEWSQRRVWLPQAALFTAKPARGVLGRILCSGTSIRDRARAHIARTVLEPCFVVKRC